MGDGLRFPLRALMGDGLLRPVESRGIRVFCMMRTISEPDWKVFRELRTLALQRLCERILDEVHCESSREDKSPHEKYLSVYRWIQRRDRDIARGFNEFSRSSALTQIAIIHSMGLFHEDELKRFSPDVHEVLGFFSKI